MRRAASCAAAVRRVSRTGRVWNDGVSQAGTPHGSTTTQVFAELGWSLALGALILYFAAAALGRLSVRSVRDVELSEEARTMTDDPAATAAPAPRTGTPRRRRTGFRERRHSGGTAPGTTPRTDEDPDRP